MQVMPVPRIGVLGIRTFFSPIAGTGVSGGVAGYSVNRFSSKLILLNRSRGVRRKERAAASESF